MSGSGAAIKTMAFHHGRTAAGKYSHAAERAGWLDSTRTLSGWVAELLRTGRSERSQLRDRSTIDLQIFDLFGARRSGSRVSSLCVAAESRPADRLQWGEGITGF